MKHIYSKLLITSIASLSMLSVSNFHSNDANASTVDSTPKSIRGTWYNYNKESGTFDRIKIVKNAFYDGNKKFKNDMGKREKRYYSFYSSEGSKSGYSDGLAAWTKKMKIKGHYQSVLVTYQRQGAFVVFTKKPIKHDYSYVLTGKKLDHYQYYIGR